MKKKKDIKREFQYREESFIPSKSRSPRIHSHNLKFFLLSHDFLSPIMFFIPVDMCPSCLTNYLSIITSSYAHTTINLKVRSSSTTFFSSHSYERSCFRLLLYCPSLVLFFYFSLYKFLVFVWTNWPVGRARWASRSCYVG